METFILLFYVMGTSMSRKSLKMANISSAENFNFCNNATYEKHIEVCHALVPIIDQ